MMASAAAMARTAIIAAAAGCAAVLVVACGTNGAGSPPAAGGTPASSSPASQPAPSQPASTPSGPAACATSALEAEVPAADAGAAAGSTYYPIQFTNSSDSTCSLYGYPGVSFVTGNGGSQIGAPATENPAHPRQLIELAPGQVAHAELQVADAQNYPPSRCTIVTANWLRIYPPNQTAPLYVSFTAQTCSNNQSNTTVETFQAGATGA
jgi:hypothetical protein